MKDNRSKKLSKEPTPVYKETEETRQTRVSQQRSLASQTHQESKRKRLGRNWKQEQRRSKGGDSLPYFMPWCLV